jgi:hypothetical protein
MQEGAEGESGVEVSEITEDKKVVNKEFGIDGSEDAASSVYQRATRRHVEKSHTAYLS